ncbi:hypothetical protein N878_04750 [Pseudomonas sp. EGD-AK9]|uniref:class I SAM-dependent methyltransferase n=1 Tax=Pseudomonas sp. EGD-AK9 TaxID=1386078 RepID=UPI00039661A0|nr:class I SAM-dependent methyltransferase [Pseudomonas sp. EGD-AK9]ERI52664.1 hypothetical protein N878_04750 [Pseudomonas sp. EGD-AK9]
MLERLKRRFTQLKPQEAVVAVSVEEAPVLLPVGLIDMARSGWLKNDSGELFAGFAVKASDSLLDIGCGDGGFTLFCGRQGAEIYVADIDEGNVERAVARLRETDARAVHPLVTDANPIPLPDAHLDKVVAMEVLEHVDDPATFLAELVRVGKPGAQYLISVPAALSERSQQGIASPAYFQKPNHIHIFEREEFARLVSDAGLVIEQHTEYGFYRTLWWLFFWVSGQSSLDGQNEAIIRHWDATWAELLSLPQGDAVKQVLDGILPKSQIIVARKK